MGKRPRGAGVPDLRGGHRCSSSRQSCRSAGARNSGCAASEERYREVVESQTDLVCRYLAGHDAHLRERRRYCRGSSGSRPNNCRAPVPGGYPRNPRGNRRCGHLARVAGESSRLSTSTRCCCADGSSRWQQWVDHAILGPDGARGRVPGNRPGHHRPQAGRGSERAARPRLPARRDGRAVRIHRARDQPAARCDPEQCRRRRDTAQLRSRPDRGAAPDHRRHTPGRHAGRRGHQAHAVASAQTGAGDPAVRSQPRDQRRAAPRCVATWTGGASR